MSGSLGWVFYFWLPGVRGPVVLFCWVGDAGGGAGGFEKSDTTFQSIPELPIFWVFETMSMHSTSCPGDVFWPSLCGHDLWLR